MSRKTVQFYDYIYVQYTDSEIFLYDTINRHTFVYNIAKKFYSFCYGIMVIEVVNHEIKYFLNIISKNNLCIVSEYSYENKYFVYQGYFTRLNRWKGFVDAQIGNDFIANNYVSVLTIFLDSYFEPFTLEQRGSFEMKILDIEVLRKFLYKGSFSSLKKIQLVGTISSLISVLDILSQLTRRVDVEIFMPIQDFIDHNPIFLKAGNLSVTLVCIGYNSAIQTVLEQKNINVLCFLKEEEDIFLLENEGLLFNKKNIIKFSKTCDYHFLKKYLRYSKKDIIIQKNDINKIIINELCNELFWGKLIVNENGDILLNFNEIIGSISNIEQADFTSLLSKESFWVMTRKNFPKCTSCHYNCLCQPLTLIELLKKQVFCNFNVK